jgi:ornithine cyclodeaminase
VDEITIFDGTGVSVQDLAVAAAVVDRACTNGMGTEIQV